MMCTSRCCTAGGCTRWAGWRRFCTSFWGNGPRLEAIKSRAGARKSTEFCVALPGRAFLLAEYSGKNADADLTDTDGCVAKPTAAAEHVGPKNLLKKYLAGGTACPT